MLNLLCTLACRSLDTHFINVLPFRRLKSWSGVSYFSLVIRQPRSHIIITVRLLTHVLCKQTPSQARHVNLFTFAFEAAITLSSTMVMFRWYVAHRGPQPSLYGLRASEHSRFTPFLLVLIQVTRRGCKGREFTRQRCADYTVICWAIL